MISKEHSLTKQLLLSSNYWVLNKTVVKIFGLETAFLLSNFAEAEQMMADEEGWFYQTSDTVEEMTTLSRHKQDQCIKQLEEMNVLLKDVRGMPAKRYFKINYQCLTNLIVNSQQTSLQKIDKQDCKKSTTNKESINKESINKESTNYIVEQVINYLNDKANTNYRTSTNKTKALIRSRINEGFVLDDFIKVIDIKARDWINDKKMCKYLRPETLFGSKFEGYLNQNYNESDKEMEDLKIGINL